MELRGTKKMKRLFGNIISFEMMSLCYLLLVLLACFQGRAGYVLVVLLACSQGMGGSPQTPQGSLERDLSSADLRADVTELRSYVHCPGACAT